MAATRCYDEDLRAIGQALEARDISVFELKRLADNYVIQGTPEQTGSLRSKVRQWLLDASEFELVELQKRRISITLLYRDKAGQQREEDRPISSFYRLFLELYGKRGQTQQNSVAQELK